MLNIASACVVSASPMSTTDSKVKTWKEAATLVPGDLVLFSQVVWRVTKVGPWAAGIKGATYIFGCNPMCRPEVEGHALGFIRDEFIDKLIAAQKAARGEVVS